MLAEDAPINSWKDFEDFIEALSKEKAASKYQTIVIDTVDNLWLFLCFHICKVNGWEHISQPGFAKGYDIAGIKLANAIAALRATGKAIIFVSHERQESELDDNGNRTGATFITSKLPNSARKVIHGNVDFIFRVEHGGEENGGRVLRTAPYRDKKEIIECGSRGSEYKDGKPIRKGLPELVELSFPTLHKAFKQSFTNGE